MDEEAVSNVRTLGVRASMADVGRAAGVSAQTVSRFFSGTGYVSAATRARISAAVEELGYRPNRAAGSLRARRTGTIGVLTVGELVHGSAQILTGLSQGARTLEQTLMHAQVDIGYEADGWQEEVRRAVDHFLSVPVDGIIVSASIPGVDEMLDAARGYVPVVNLSERPRSAADSVGTHSFTAGLEGTRHLIDLGHTGIVHVAGPATRNEALERELGYRQAMEEAGLAPVVLGSARDWSSAPGYEAGCSVDPDSFTAVFAANDELALGFLSALEQAGRKAPDDYSIVGVDDMPAAAYFSPPLTTMRLDFRGVGRTSLRMMHEMIRTGKSTPRRTIEPELVVRRSTARPTVR
ncbi:LacI family DNA-binding transcriptional regulator [Brachybacterium alimentarium]|uniref:LacI family DNA-binding transcriptional regulator n=1 Tax=Brachybacterium alimentarium TaxID=47845 RepID=UPI003FD416FC